MKEPVSHEKYGEGFAIKKRYNGFEKLVHFSNGIKKWIKNNELKFHNFLNNESNSTESTDIYEKSVGNDKKTIMSSTNIIPSYKYEDKYASLNNIDEKSGTDSVETISNEPFPITKKKHDLVLQNELDKSTENCFSSRKIIESLRLGGVPQQDIKKFTFGRDDEIERVNKWLKGDDGSLIISGNYGVGKSHLLEVIASIAIENGWAVSRVEIDPNETPFHKPRRLYNNFTNNFCYKQDGELLYFNDFIRNIAMSKSSEKEKLFQHPYLGELLTYWYYGGNFGYKSQLLDWIRGEGNNCPYRLPKLFDEQTASNIYCNIISALGWAANNIFSLNGILILFDESESIDPFWYTRYQFDKASNFLRGSVLMSNNDKRLLKDNRHSYFSELNLRYCGRKNYKYPFLWEEKSHTKLIFSFVPEMMEFLEKYPEIYSLFNNMEKIDIDSLDEDNLKHIYKKIFEIYEEAYSFTATHDIYNYIPDVKTRKFVKGTVEGLDLMRFNPNKTPDELLVNYD